MPGGAQHRVAGLPMQGAGKANTTHTPAGLLTLHFVQVADPSIGKLPTSANLQESFSPLILPYVGGATSGP